MKARMNIAARAAEWSATHRKAAIFGWLAFVVVSLAIGGAVGQRQLTDAESVSGESGRAEVALEQAKLTANSENVLVQSKGESVDDPGFRAAIADVTRSVTAVPSVSEVSSPVSGGGQVSSDGHSALVEFQIPRDDEVAEEKVDASLAAVAAVAAPSPGHADRADRRRQRQQGAGSGLQRRPQQGGDDLAAGHADHPRARLRRPGRGLGAAAAGVLGGARDDRPAGAAEPARADGPQRLRRRGPRRPGGRASTTRCSTCAASAKSAGPGARRRRPWRPRPRPRAGPSSSPG